MSINKYKVYIASSLMEDLSDLLRKKLEEIGYGECVQIEELSLIGFCGNQTLSEEAVKKIPSIDILFGDPDILGQVYNHPGSKLKWAHSTTAGDFVFTRRCGGLARQMGEFVVGRIIYRERSFDFIQDLQRGHHFPPGNLEIRSFRTLDEIHLGIIGYGEMGRKVAQCCKALGMTIWTAVRDQRYNEGDITFDNVDQIRPMSRLSEMLESCDYVVNLLPSTPITVNLLSGDVLKPCQHKKTVLINVGRGNIIDDDSLVKAIKNGWLGGAILDVFNEEPLPFSSPIWNLPGVILSPHTSATFSSCKKELVDDCIYNLRCYMEGTPMKFKVDLSKQY